MNREIKDLWFISANEERYDIGGYETKEEAIKKAKEDLFEYQGDDYTEPMTETFWIAQCKHLTEEKLLQFIDLEDYFENIEENLADEGVTWEESLLEGADEAFKMEDINKEIVKFLFNRYNLSNHCYIDSDTIEKHTIEITQEDIDNFKKETENPELLNN